MFHRHVRDQNVYKTKAPRLYFIPLPRSPLIDRITAPAELQVTVRIQSRLPRTHNGKTRSNSRAPGGGNSTRGGRRPRRRVLHHERQQPDARRRQHLRAIRTQLGRLPVLPAKLRGRLLHPDVWLRRGTSADMRRLQQVHHVLHRRECSQRRAGSVRSQRRRHGSGLGQRECRRLRFRHRRE